MSEKQKSCPKCGGEMQKRLLHKWGSAGWSISGISVLIPYVCKECGYVEFYSK